MKLGISLVVARILGADSLHMLKDECGMYLHRFCTSFLQHDHVGVVCYQPVEIVIKETLRVVPAFTHESCF